MQKGQIRTFLFELVYTSQFVVIFLISEKILMNFGYEVKGEEGEAVDPLG